MLPPPKCFNYKVIYKSYNNNDINITPEYMVYYQGPKETSVCVNIHNKLDKKINLKLDTIMVSSNKYKTNFTSLKIRKFEKKLNQNIYFSVKTKDYLEVEGNDSLFIYANEYHKNRKYLVDNDTISIRILINNLWYSYKLVR
jgi:hypothetical protein